MIHTTFLAILAGCTAGQSESIGEVLTDFTLPDVNETSATYGTDVTVSSFQGQVSAWYFGHAT